MKKLFLLVFSGVLIIGLTGCGGKKQISCTMIETREDIHMSMKYEVLGEYDSDDKIVDVAGSVYADLSEISGFAEQICDMLKQRFPDAKVECSKTEVKVSEFMTEEQKKDAIGKTTDTFKKTIENSGFTCK